MNRITQEQERTLRMYLHSGAYERLEALEVFEVWLRMWEAWAESMEVSKWQIIQK